MYTYLRVEELIQEGRELLWLATAFEGREVPEETCSLYDSWVARVRQWAGRSSYTVPEDDTLAPEAPRVGRELARRADGVLALLERLKGVPGG
ncbi:MAG: hypothetical protein HY321_19080 [Armatimonadetes bacterium]|nr:hypothetical protein [Armatimonadota bacterium]